MRPRCCRLGGGSYRIGDLIGDAFDVELGSYEMESRKPTNAAARLHQILATAQSLNSAGTYQQLPIAFGLRDKADTVALLRALVQAAETLDEIGTLVKKIPAANHELFLRGFDRLKAGLAAAASNTDFNQWKTNYLRPEQIQTLEYCADLLSRHYLEDEIAPADLQKILEHVAEVYESVMASGLDAELKAVILESLERIRQSVHDYRMKGVYGLKEALASATGELVLHREEVTQAANSDQKPEVDRVFHLLEYLDKITAIATRGKEMFAPLLPYYPYLLAKGVEIVDKLKHV